MTKIKKLSDKTINQIAAGEVVDRPASVIKELVENAIDAGATWIFVEIESGGKNCIRISDNGCGMEKSDLELAVERHATSKLDEENINCINSLGFRGEALPSIGSVSNLTITTRQNGEEHAWSIHISGGERNDPIPAAREIGTTVEVKDLFVHTPARLKFMRSEATERAHAISLIQEFALCYPHTHFCFASDGETILDCPIASNEEERLAQLFGAEFEKNMVPVNRRDINIKGFVGIPTFTHRTSANQHIFINGRSVKDKQIFAAIKAAYTNLMTHGFFAAVILHLSIDPYEVDVNVHPAKTEVRLRDPNKVKGFVITAIRSALSSAPSSTSTMVVDSVVSVAKSSIQAKPIESKIPFNFNDNAPSHYQAAAPRANYAPPSPAPMLQPVVVEHPLGNALFQIDATYIIAQNSEGLVLVDQHAAHERLVLERMKNSVVNLKSQNLLIPQVVDLGAALTTHLLEHVDELSKFGLAIERNGITQVIVRQIPEFLDKDATPDVLKEIAQMLMQDSEANILESKRDEIWGNIACHSSIRAGRKLSIPEMNAILRQIESTPFASQCNHGRPTFVIIKPKDLAKIFERTS